MPEYRFSCHDNGEYKFSYLSWITQKMMVTSSAKNTGLLVEVPTDVQDRNGGSSELEHAVATGDAIPAICEVA